MRSSPTAARPADSNRALKIALVVSLALHALLSAFVPGYFAHALPAEDIPEAITISNVVHIDRPKTPYRKVVERNPQTTARAQARSRSAPPAPAEAQQHHAQAAPSRSEIAREVPNAPHLTSRSTSISADEARFAKTIAQVKAADNPLNVSSESTEQGTGEKRYSMFSGTGDKIYGYIKPIRSWIGKDGYDWYYVHIDVYFPNGTSESDDVPWPIRYRPDQDPFPRGDHSIPLPPPLPGWQLPPGTQLTPFLRRYLSPGTGGG